MQSFDFSTRNELKLLAAVASALAQVADSQSIDFMIIGATARDALLRYGYGIEVGRGTEDVDFAVMVSDWQTYETLRESLIASTEFAARSRTAHHKLKHRSGLPLDIVPFGGIERPDRTIAWPPDNAIVIDCFGAAEAFAATVDVKLPGDLIVRVPTIPALAILKIAAWHDRQRESDGRDAQDLALYMRTYLDCGNYDRAAADHADLFDDEEYDHEIASARLLGRDIARLVDKEGIERCLKTLLPEADAHGRVLLARKSGVSLDRACALIRAMCDGLALTKNVRDFSRMELRFPNLRIVTPAALLKE